MSCAMASRGFCFSHINHLCNVKLHSDALADGTTRINPYLADKIFVVDIFKQPQTNWTQWRVERRINGAYPPLFYVQSVKHAKTTEWDQSLHCLQYNWVQAQITLDNNENCSKVINLDLVFFSNACMHVGKNIIIGVVRAGFLCYLGFLLYFLEGQVAKKSLQVLEVLEGGRFQG